MFGFKSFLNEEFLVGKQSFRHPLPAMEYIYKTFKRPENLVVTFTSIDKVGINPQTPYNTPVGIYFYPFKFVIEQKLKVPFAGEQPYINVCKLVRPHKILHMRPSKTQKGMERLNYIPRSILNTVNTRGWEYRSDYSELWLTTMQLARQPNYMPPEPTETPWLANYKKESYLAQPFSEMKAKMSGMGAEDQMSSYMQQYKKNALQLQNFWNAIPPDNDIVANNYMYNIEPNKKLKRTQAVLWNRYLRDAGIDGFIDHGTGTIHPNEPTQGVVFTADAIERLYLIPNVKDFFSLKKIQTNKMSLDNIRKYLISNNHKMNVVSSIMGPIELSEPNDQSPFKDEMEAAKFIVDNKPSMHENDIRQLLEEFPLKHKQEIAEYIKNNGHLDVQALQYILISLEKMKKHATEMQNVWKSK